MYRECKSYSDQSRCVADLAEACIRLKNKLRYFDPDARTVALNNLVGIARAGQMILNLMDSWAIGNEQVRRVIPQLLGLQTVTSESVKYAGDSINKFSRLGFTVLGQFQIEIALRNIGRELGVCTNLVGFYRMATNVLEKLKLPSDLMDILNTPARIRNSLHANGIHHRTHPSDKEIVKIEGVEYRFQDGQRVTCAGWEHIAHALEHSVGVLEKIFQTPEVTALPDPIMDEYAWEMETVPNGKSGEI